MKPWYEPYQIIDENQDAEIQTQATLLSEELAELQVAVTFPSPCVPQKITLLFKTPCVETFSIWGTGLRMRQYLPTDWGKVGSKSRLASGAPLHSILSQDGENRMTFALSDAKTPCQLRSGVNEETSTLFTEVILFTSPIAPLDHYRVTVRLDRTCEPFGDTARRVDAWWQTDCGYPAAPVPTAAKMPVYSTWYSFHNDVEAEAVFKQCEMAKALGMDTVIVDAGWEMEGPERTFAYCGDWVPAKGKFPNMKAFSDRVHALGMKVMFWFSVPFVGKRSRAYEIFQDMLLGIHQDEGENSCYRLDPRYPEVRAYLVEIYRHAMLEWGIDGFKLDFIDSFEPRPTTPETDPRRDIVSLEDAIDRLLEEVTAALRAINPDVLIEFRQTYTGPVIRKYGNMFRVFDCPNDLLRNRFAMGELRTLMGNAAVHSDMLEWHDGDTKESVARQLLSTLFMVPQVSVRVHELSKEHYRVLQNYLTLWREHQAVLLDGDFRAYDPVAHYSRMTSQKDGTLIAVAYFDTPLELGEAFEKILFFNATAKERLTLRPDLPEATSYTCRIYNCVGELISEETRALEKGICDFPVPDGGRVELCKN
ncbi:MAG: alpha-galactosidase [Clostridia bacterium]|nr:alpha-galactosidase [Clostridia bacterium]